MSISSRRQPDVMDAGRRNESAGIAMGEEQDKAFEPTRMGMDEKS
jgi:hypothetical protein